MVKVSRGEMSGNVRRHYCKTKKEAEDYKVYLLREGYMGTVRIFHVESDYPYVVQWNPSKFSIFG